MINIQNLNIHYGNKHVIKDLNIDFQSGKVYGIIGLNGAGKTTFFNTLNGAKKYSSGHIEHEGKPLNKEAIAFLETQNFYYSYITGREYLDIFTQTNPNFNMANFEKIFALPLDELIENYSTGMKKKLSLIAILKKEKPIYILDEPFNGLDLESNKVVEIVISLLRNKQKTVFISSHILDPLLKICDEICLLKDGNFQKKYSGEEFHKIESDLFGTFGDEARTLLEGSI